MHDVSARENYLLTVAFARTVKGGETGLSEAPKVLRKLIRRRAWENIYSEPTKQMVRFNSIREWIEAYPPEGLNTKPQVIEALIKDDADLMVEFKTLIAGDLRGHGGDRKQEYQGSGRTLIHRGESSEYLAARLKRDAPEYLERIGTDKEYSTIKQAAIAAGIAKPRQRIELKPDPQDFAGTLIERCDRDFLAQVVAILSEAL